MLSFSVQIVAIYLLYNYRVLRTTQFFWRKSVKKISKLVALTALVSLMSACTTTTTPQASTFWAKSGSGYNTHHDRIRTHDKRMFCDKQVFEDIHIKNISKSEKKAEMKVASDACMIEQDYEERQNWVKIKETAKKIK